MTMSTTDIGSNVVPFSTPHSSTATLHNSTLAADARRDEQRLEAYGADDPREPSELGSSNEKGQKSQAVTWDGPDDPENPQNWSKGYKWFVTSIVILLSLNVTFESSAPSSTIFPIVAQFGIPVEQGYLVTSTFLFGYVIGPVLWGPGSELVGRRPVFVLTVATYTLLHLGQALAQNITTLLVTRFLGGIFAVAPLTNSGGLVADIWDPIGRNLAVSLFTASVFMGPVLGPVVSSFIVESSLGWRWVYWVMMMFAGVCALVTIFLLPETYAPVILQRKARRLRAATPELASTIFAEHENQDWSIKGVLQRTILRPFSMLAKEPILLLVTIYMSLLYGVIYALFEAVPIVFMHLRGFTVQQTGLLFIGVGIGTSIGSFIFHRLAQGYPALLKEWDGFPPAEVRLRGAMIGGPLFVVGCFWFGWAGAYSRVPWYVPALGLVIIGVSVALVFMSFLSYLVDTYLMYAASALSASTLVRSAVAAGFPLFTVQMFTSLGVQWAATLLGLVALLLAPSPFLFSKYGPRIRARSTYAPCMDLKIAKARQAAKESAMDV